MKNVKRIALLMALVMTIMLLPIGCGQRGEETTGGVSDERLDVLNETGFPITKEPVDLRFFVGTSVNHDRFKDLIVMQEYENMTNMNIDWNQSDTTNDSQLREKINIELATNAPNDGYFKISFPIKDIITYGQQGKFIGLKDLIDKYAPNMKKLLDENPDLRKGLTMPDGEIYGFPYLIMMPMGFNLFINNDWLDTVGMEMPKTTDEFYNVLKAFKGKDFDGNGKSDEVPLTATKIGDIVSGLKGAWGLGNRGLAHPNVDIDEQTNELRFIPTDEKYKDMLIYLRKLYQEGLIDTEIFTMNHSKFVAKITQGLVGASLHGQHRHDAMVGINEALEGPFGDKMWNALRSNISSPATFVITDHNPHPEATVRWVDYFYGEEGATFFFMGMEGETYQTLPDGSLEYLETVFENDRGLDHDQAMGRFLPWVGGRNPALITEKWFKGGETAPQSMNAMKNMNSYQPTEIWSAFSYTAEENDSIVALENDILSYIDEMTASFIMNEGEIESLWDEYLTTLDKMDLSKYMSLYKAAYERYNN
jgi:putative aldouronate transport system substrate-binding protein